MKKILHFTWLVVFALFMVSCQGDDVEDTLTVQFNTIGGDTIASLQIKSDRLDIELPVPTKDGNMFEGWFIDEALTIPFNPETHFTNGTVTVYAAWSTIEEIRVSFSVFGEIIATETVSSNGTISFPVDPSLPFYTFDGWYADPEFITLVESSDLFSQDMVLYANFTYDPSTESVFEPIYYGPPINETEEFRFEQVLITDKALLNETDVVIFYDFSYYLISVANIEADVGDIVSFDAVVYSSTNDETYIIQIDNVTVHSSNNPITITPIHASELINMREQDINHPVYITLEGLMFYRSEEIDVFESTTSERFDIFLAGDVTRVDRPMHGEIVVLFLSVKHNEGLISSAMGQPNLTEVDDEDIVDKMELFLLDYFDDMTFQVGDRFSFDLNYGTDTYEFNLSTTVKEAYTQYFGSSRRTFYYTSEMTEVMFEVTVQYNDITKTFDVPFTLDTVEVLSIGEYITRSKAGEKNLFFEATVIFSSGNSFLLFDGIDMIKYIWDFNDSEERMVPGTSHVFSNLYNYSLIEIKNNFYFYQDMDNANYYGFSRLSDLTYPACNCGIDDLYEDMDLWPTAILVEGTLHIQEVEYSTFDFIYLDTGTHRLYLVGSSTFMQLLKDQYLGEHIALEVFVEKYDTIDVYGTNITGFFGTVVNEEILMD